mgnify:FL=1|jgi:hypothetical protein
MSKRLEYTILNSGSNEFVVRESRQTYTGVRWITLTNTVAIFSTLEEAQKKYPKARVTDLGEMWWDNLTAHENMPSNLE